MTSKKDYVKTEEAAEICGVCAKTIITYADKGIVQSYTTIGGHRRYRRADLERLRTSGKEETKNPEKIKDIWKVAYARVSSRKQSEDLERQKTYLRETYPEYQIIADIGSGTNFQRISFKKILERAIAGNEVHLAIAHRDRLCRFGFDLIEFIINETGGSIICKESTLEKSRDEELAEDLLAVIQVFNCKQSNKRRYEKTIRVGKEAIGENGNSKISCEEN